MYRKLQSVQSSLPTVLANEGTRFFVGSFDKEGWDGKSWKVPQRRIAGTPAFKYPKNKDLGRRTKRTLVKTGNLRRAVNNSVKQKTFKRIVWNVDTGTRYNYAAVHNEGLGKIPQRRFMGESKTLNAIFKRKILQAYNRGLN